MRDWLEGRRWYWFTINLSFNVFPWHWETEWSKYEWGLVTKFGPFGVFMMWEPKERWKREQQEQAGE